MLNNFFRINLPYGIGKNDKGDWMAFNREYMPLGFNDLNYKHSPIHSYKDFPVHTKYKLLTDKMLSNLSDEEHLITRNEAGEIVIVFFYNDSTNPVNNSSEELWQKYFKKIKKLAKLERSDNY